MKLLIVYHTKTGHTLEAIRPFVERVQKAGSEAEVVLAKDFDPAMVAEYDAFLVGTPCWGGSSGVYGVALPLVKELKNLPKDSLKGKLCGGIVVHAKYGGKTTLKHLQQLLSKKGCENFLPGPVVKAGTLGSVFKGRSVTKNDEELVRIYGSEFVNNNNSQ